LCRTWKRLTALIWEFALELIDDPETLLRAYQQVQAEDAEKYDEVKDQITTLELEIQARERELTALVTQARKSSASSLRVILEGQAEELGVAIDQLTLRKTKLEEEYAEDAVTDAVITQLVAEVEGLRQIYEALHAIDEEADFDAKRALIDILNITATLRVDSDGAKWVDIHWLAKTYPRIVDPAKHNPSPSCQA
jgi:chromosome segregation ATPase